MSDGIRSAFTERAGDAAVAHLAEQLAGLDPTVIVFFSGHERDGAALSRDLKARFTGAEVLGCTSAGEFASAGSGRGGVSLLALTGNKVRRASTAMADFSGGVQAGMAAALQRLAGGLSLDLRQADPKRYVGIVLIEGLGMHEEEVNEYLGNAAPLLSFVGGSAGDDLLFRETRLFLNGSATNNGAVLLLMEAAVPFVIGKTCSFRPVGSPYRVTRADAKTRTVYELDGKPVLEAYAKLVGKTPAQLDGDVFRVNPLGLVIDGKPWIRSPMQAQPDGGLKFYCAIREGMDVYLMEGTDLVGETRAAIADWNRELGAPIAGGFAFNCVLRRLDLDKKELHGPFLDSFKGMQVAGFHTYGESWLGHINQTLTAIFFA